jgi:hypothetical protein
MKNMLYRRTDDIEKLRVAVQQLVEVVDPLEDGAANGDPCWSDFVELRRKSSASSPRPLQHMLALP